MFVFFFKQKTAYEMRISDWSSDVCSSDLRQDRRVRLVGDHARPLVDLHERAGHRDAALREDDAVLALLHFADERAGRQGRRGVHREGLDQREEGPHPPARRRVSVDGKDRPAGQEGGERSEEHTSELQSLMRISYAVFCLKKKKKKSIRTHGQ